MATTLKAPAPAYAPGEPRAATTARAPRSSLATFLITADDTIWPQIGKFVPGRFALKQCDSIEQLLEQIDMGATAVLLWDAREESGFIARLSCLQQHSPRFAVLVFDTAAQAAVWEPLIRQNQIVAQVNLPICEGEFVKALNQAGDEVQARAALLGDNGQTDPPARVQSGGRSKVPWMIGAMLALSAILAAAWLLPHSGSAPPAMPAALAPADTSLDPPAARVPDTGVSAQVETLLESAGQSMLERRYVTPADNNALSFYRRVLTFDADNGEARQGLERLAELLLGRAQSALDQRQFEQALQALEIARSLKPNDPRTAALDQRLVGMRAEFGAAQIQAALSAQNFDRAAALIDEALRAKSVSGAQAVQLRETLKRQRSDFEAGRFVKLAQARLQQERLIDPSNDNAAYYLDRARRAGVSPAAIAAETRTLQQKLMEAARAAIDQRRFTDADRWLTAAREESAGPAAITALQNDLTAARSRDLRPKPDPQLAGAPGAGAPQESPADVRVSAAAGEKVAQPALVLRQPPQPRYPQAAALKGVEGWVDLSFSVTADGKPVNVQVLNASPAGVFDKAAVAALQRARYQPLSTTEPATIRQANLRVSFRLSR